MVSVVFYGWKRGGEMNFHNDLHVKLYAEDYIRARLKEAENYRMLGQLRKNRQKRILRPFYLFLGWLGRSFISAGERLQNIEFSSLSESEDGWAGLSMLN
jgi:hypothetical protein